MLEVMSLTAGYRTGPVAHLAELTLKGGEAALLLGPSGVGKTTLLLAFAGLARRFAGTATIDGIDPYDLSASARDRFRGRTVGFVFQDLHLIVGLSALDNVLLAPFAAGAKQEKERAQQLLERLGVGAAVHQRAEQLSRGQAQRVAIARAMLLRPKIILADEPTASLDDATCSVVADLLIDAATETGAALVIATHDARLKQRIARQISVRSPP